VIRKQKLENKITIS